VCERERERERERGREREREREREEQERSEREREKEISKTCLFVASCGVLTLLNTDQDISIFAFNRI
jgi:hypothetical protein